MLQTHKWRRPKYIKFPNLLEDERWLGLSNDAKATWMSILLIASECRNYELPPTKTLFRRLQSLGNCHQLVKFERVIHELIQCGFLVKSTPELQSYRVTEFQKGVDTRCGASSHRSEDRQNQEVVRVERVGNEARGENPQSLAQPNLTAPPNSGFVPRGTRLPEHWSPTEGNIQYALDKGLDLNRIGIEAEKFRNYWTSKPGRGATKLNWCRTWENWILKATQENGHGRKQGLGELAEELAAEAREREIAAGIVRPDDFVRKH